MKTHVEEGPVAGALVSFVPHTPGARTVSASTGVNGLAALAIPSGYYEVTVSAQGFEMLRTSAHYVGIDSALDVVLTPADPDRTVAHDRRRSAAWRNGGAD